MRSSTNLVDPGMDGCAVTNGALFANAAGQNVEARGIYVGVAGDVELITVSGTTLTFKNAIAGTIIPVRCTKVVAALTTATNLIAVW